jgi:hypothetical protein
MARHRSKEPGPLAPVLGRLIQAAEGPNASAHAIALRRPGALALWPSSILLTRTLTATRANEREVNARPTRGLNSGCHRRRDPRPATRGGSAAFAPPRGTR